MFYLDFQQDFMQSFNRAFLAKEIIDRCAGLAEPVKVWTTHNPRIELDAANRFLLIDGGSMFRFDFIWIENLARFFSIETSYKAMGPEQLVKGVQSYQLATSEAGPLNLYLFPWHHFPAWPEIGGSFAGKA